MAQVKNVRTGGEASAESAPAIPVAAKPTDGIVYVTDKRGRRLGLKKLRPSQRFALEEATATKTPSGEMQAIFAASVISIDQDGMPPITNRQGLMARLDELDDDGLTAITPACLELYGIQLTDQDVIAAKN